MNKLAIISQVQKQVDDDELMEEFGITPEKLNTVNAQGFQLNNARTINWEQ